jgi:CBS domain-containing protein
MKDMPVSKFMTSPLVTVAPDAPLSSALTLMKMHGLHHLLVIDQGHMAGILSSADLLKLALLQLPEESAATSESPGIRVRDVMQARVAVVRENASLREVASALSLGGFHALPVLAIDGTPVGIVTSSDLVALLIDQIERETPSPLAIASPPDEPRSAMNTRLLEVLRAAEVYLQSGQSGQQHSKLTRAIDRAREFAVA